MDVRKWLEDMGLGEHAPGFEEQAIEAEEDLVDLTAEDLREMYRLMLMGRRFSERALELAEAGRLSRPGRATGTPKIPFRLRG